MATPQAEFTIDDYFRKRLMPVDSAIPQLGGIDMYGIPLLPDRLAYAINQDEHLKQIGQEDRVDDKTALVIKHKCEVRVRRQTC